MQPFLNDPSADSSARDSLVIEIRAELRAALVQMTSTDDQIIADHVRNAYFLLERLLSKKRRWSDP